MEQIMDHVLFSVWLKFIRGISTGILLVCVTDRVELSYLRDWLFAMDVTLDCK